MGNYSNHDLAKVLGWCFYCHREIYAGEDYRVDKGEMYHSECFKQMNTYQDPYFIDED